MYLTPCTTLELGMALVKRLCGSNAKSFDFSVVPFIKELLMVCKLEIYLLNNLPLLKSRRGGSGLIRNWLLL